MPRISEKSLFSLIGSLYDIAQQPLSAPWLEVYSEMAALFSSGPGGLSVFNTREDTFNLVVGTTDPAFLKKYVDHYQERSPFRQKLSALVPGERFNRQEFLSDSDFREHEIYEEFYRTGDVFHIEYRAFLRYDDVHAGIAFTRPDSKPNFSANELKAVTYLMPHLARAFRLYFNLLDVHRENNIAKEAFDRLAQGVIVLDRDLKPVFVNATAEDQLSGRDGLHIAGNGVLEASSPAANGRLKCALTALFDGDGLEQFGSVVSIDRPSGLRSFELLLAPFTQNDVRLVSTGKFAIIFVTDPDANPVNAEQTMIEMYGLTPSEAHLAQLVAEGRTLAEASDEISISLHTAKTHLKRIFHKTDTNRQSALVRLILSGPRNIRRIK
ncbi:MAG: helix-turn-helix transcriptional regulator [Pyrinomonadaceae bacterium]